MTIRKLVRVVLLCVLIPLLFLMARSEFEANRAWHRAEASHAAGDTYEYLYHLQRCAKWNTYFGAHSRQAFQKLVDFATAASEEKRDTEALIAWRYARGSILATTHLFSRPSDSLERINRSIANLMAAQQINANAITVQGRSQAEIASEHLALLAERHGPSPWGAFAIIGVFALWVASLFWLIRYGVRKDGGLNWSVFWRGGLVSSFLFGGFCWTLATF